MKTIYLENMKFEYEIGQLAKIFLPQGNYEIKNMAKGQKNESGLAIFLPGYDKNKAKRELYRILQEETGYAPPWGTLTGVRPCKIADELFERHKMREETAEPGELSYTAVKRAEAEVMRLLEAEYLISPEKIDLLIEIHETQSEKRMKKGEKRTGGAKQGGREKTGRERIGVYVGIPFCPTRCAYCSFPSNARDDKAVQSYLNALFKEVKAVGEMIEKKRFFTESLYIGGGTPTSLTDDELDRLLRHIKEYIDISGCSEFTLEAGRPDTITDEKLRIIKENGAKRISINPQTMKQETLDIIGRHHSTQDVVRSAALADRLGIETVNMDIIAGLPGESAADFKDSLYKVINMSAQNITVHTLAIKKASRFKEEQPKLMPDAGEVEKMLRMSREILREAGYRPYYLYRQKYMSGNFENVGYALPGTESCYNIRIMEEKQTIIAMGAGGISKFYFPDENRLERVANVSDYKIYIDRIDEMIKRKQDFFEKWLDVPLIQTENLIQ